MATLNVVDTSGMTKEERFRLRKIGASDSPIICGVGYKGKTRLSLWFDKTNQSQASDNEEYAERFWWGDELEPIIAKRFTIKTGMKFAAQQVLVVHPEHEWMSATIDGVTEDGSIVDFKASSYWGGKGIIDGDDDTLPEGWIIQANHQMACCGRDRAHWAQFAGAELKLKTFVIHRDEAIVDLIITLGEEFMEHVRNGTPPAEFESRDSEFLKRQFNRRDGRILDLTADTKLLAAAVNFDNAKAAIKEMEEERDRQKAALMLAVGDADGARLGGGWYIDRKQINVKGDPNPKPKLPSSYIRFDVKNGG